MSNWSVVSDCNVEGAYARVRKLKSSTGLKLLHVDVEGPIVNTYIALATEAEDDDGLPHTLEHLIFLGSELYPYKGLLDIFANRCYASGTNAWTDIDNTVYTLSTAGAKGTLVLLPIYMNHILYPLLTQQGFVTEVHHISGEGEDGGVVYSEMQGRENGAESRCLRKLSQEIYKKTGYACETGGIMENLRVSTTNEKIKKFHSMFYRPENITIIVAGQINEQEILEALKSVDDIIMEKNKTNPPPPFIRPWQSTVPPLEETKIIKHKYPNDSEDCGLIMIGWRGPQILDTNGLYEITACSILLRLLCDTPIAPFQKALVEIENPYASDITSGIIENSVSMLMITLENVPTAKLDDALPAFRQVITTLSTKPNALETGRLRSLIQKTIREFLGHMENKPHDTLTFMCLSDMLYSTNENQFGERLNKRKILKNLENESCTWWEALFKKYFLKDFIAIIGEPSCDLMVEMSEAEATRISLQKEALGVDGLAEKGEELKQAMDFNDKEAPPNVVKCIGVNDIDDLKRFVMKSWNTGGPKCPHLNLEELPFYTRVNHLHSQFVYISLLIKTHALDMEERYYLPLLLNVITQTSFYRYKCKLEYNILVEDIERLTNTLNLMIGTSASGLFFPGMFHNVIRVSAQCEPDNYEEVVDLLWHILKKTNFEKKRVLIVAQKMVNDIATIRRQGDDMASQLIKVLVAKKESNVYCTSILQQQRFLNNLIATLEKDKNESLTVLNKFEQIRQKLIDEKNIWMHFSADLERHQFTTTPWNIFMTKDKCTEDIIEDKFQYQKQLLEPEEREGKGCIVGMGGLESSHLQQYAPGPLSFNHPDLPALLVAIQYIVQTEGPMWRMIRGGGLSYGYSISCHPILGLINFSLYKATHLFKAYEKAIEVIRSVLLTKNWDDNLFRAAKSSLIFDIVKREESPSKIINQSLLNHLKQVNPDYNITFVKHVANVTLDDCFNAAKNWLPQLFDSKRTSLAIVCNTSKINENNDSFKSLGHDNLKVYKSLEESHLGAQN